MEIYKELTTPASKEFEELLNSQLSKNKIEEGKIIEGKINKIFVKITENINKFLDNIMVNVERDDVKNNRKALLLKSKEIIDSFFKFSQIGDNAK